MNLANYIRAVEYAPGPVLDPWTINNIARGKHLAASFAGGAGEILQRPLQLIDMKAQLAAMERDRVGLKGAVQIAKKYWELRGQQGQILGKMFPDFYNSIVGKGSRIMSFAQMKNIDAHDFLNDPVSKGRGEKLIQVYESLKSAVGNAAEPLPGERMDSWTVRVFRMTMKNHEVPRTFDNKGL